MKKIVTLICTLLCANVLLAQTSFWIGDIRYYITSTNPAEVEVYDANSSITTANIPETVTYQGTDYSVTSIGNQAFYNCSSLTSVTIPNSVTAIGNSAFSDCSSLTSVTIPNSVTAIGNSAFSDCSSLTSVTIPNSVTSIGNSAFYSCSSLTSVTIPNSVTSIRYDAFRYCSALTSVTLPENATISTDAFSGYGTRNNDTIDNVIYTLYYENENIGNYTFKNVYNVTFTIGDNVYTPNSAKVYYYTSELSGDVTLRSSITYNGVTYPVTSIGGGAFGYCSSLTTLNFNAVNCNDFSSCSDSDYPFCNCPITTINIGDSVQRIPVYFACNRDDLTSIEIPNSVTSIGYSAFYNCSSLTSVTIGNSVTSVGGGAFRDCSSLTSVIIPNSVTTIGSYAFYNCSSLTSVIIPNSVTTIGMEAFYNCSSLISITIPNASIGNNAFDSCSALTSVSLDMSFIPANLFPQSIPLQNLTFGENVTSIASGAFSPYSFLQNVTCLATTPPTIADNTVFPYPNIATLTVPCGTLEAYSSPTSFWNIFFMGRISEDCNNEGGDSGLEDVEDTEFSFFPNPTKSEITFNQAIEKIEVIDLTGRCVLTFSNAREINIESLPSGAYYLRLTNNDKAIMRKVIKE